MKSYKTSVDYPRLRKLLDEGREIVCSVHDGTVGLAYLDDTEDACYKVCDEYESVQITGSQFCEWCRGMDLEYIKPNINYHE